MSDTWEFDLCIKRLWRSRTLTVEKFITLNESNENLWKVCGGSENHIISKLGDQFICDCPDFISKDERAIPGGCCKHIIAVRRAMHDLTVISADNLIDQLIHDEERIKSMKFLDAIKLLWLIHQGPEKERPEEDRLSQLIAISDTYHGNILDNSKSNAQKSLFDF